MIELKVPESQAPKRWGGSAFCAGKGGGRAAAGGHGAERTAARALGLRKRSASPASGTQANKFRREASCCNPRKGLVEALVDSVAIGAGVAIYGAATSGDDEEEAAAAAAQAKAAAHADAVKKGSFDFAGSAGGAAREANEYTKEADYYVHEPAGLTTYEVPVSVIRALGWARMLDAMEQYGRGCKQRQRSAATVGDVLARKGVKATAVAHELGITEARVRQIRKEIEA